MKDLQKMNLVDDFLVNSLTSHKIYGECASRYILECIFRRKIGKLTVVPQRFMCGENTGDHGIRLDVYLDEEAGELLRYMEASTEENARSEGLRALHRMVTEVKRDGEVGFAYMKSFEREQRVKEEGREEGMSESRRATAANLRKMNMPIEQIAQAIDEKVEVVEQWLAGTSPRKMHDQKD